MQEQLTCKGRILLAEDDEINSELYGVTLERAGYCVRYASNGESALEALEEESFDCVIMDIEMNVLNGLEATRCIRNGKVGQSNRSVPIIGMSAHEGDLVSEFISAGINTFLHKPVELELLENTVEDFIRGGPQVPAGVFARKALLAASARLDYDGALKRLKNNSKLLDKVTEQVLEEADSQLETLRKALADMDYEAVGEVSHRYAGSLASIGAMTGSLICRELMTLARRGFVRHLEKLVNRLEQELKGVKRIVEQRAEGDDSH